MELVPVVIAVIIFVVWQIKMPDEPEYRDEKQPDLEFDLEGRRPTFTRVFFGGLLAGPLGAILGFSAQKKTKQKVKVYKRHDDDEEGS